MRIGTPAVARPGEARAAATTETVHKLLAVQQQVIDQSGACARAGNTSYE